VHKLVAIVGVLIVTMSPALAAGPTVAVLPLAAADSGMAYGILPTSSELKIMTTQLRAGLKAGGAVLVRQERLPSAVSSAGFDQTTPIRSCVVADCAQKIGRAVHADTVVVGAVTRGMSVIWGTSFSIVDVRTGKVTAEMNVGYKGDVQAMELGERDAGGCIARVIEHQKPCRSDPGW